VIVGRAAVKVPGEISAVCSLVTDLVVYPVREPATVTVSRFPFADDGTVKVLVPRVEIVTPSAFHTYFTDDGVGDHVPRLAVSVLPTCRTPLIVGRGAVKVPGTTKAVGALVIDFVGYPGRVPVVRTVIRLPTAEAGTARVERVAPAIVTPFACHEYVIIIGEGDQVPAVAASAVPTCAVPLTVGFGAKKIFCVCSHPVMSWLGACQSDPE
jgi:hypothetical protein